MFCKNCGAELADGAVICPKCGVPVNVQKAGVAVPDVQKSPNAAGGFVCSLLGFLLDWFPIVGLVLSIIGVAICSKGKKAAGNNPNANTGLMTAGLVFGIIGIVVGAIALLFTLIWCIILGNGSFFSLLEEFTDLLD